MKKLKNYKEKLDFRIYQEGENQVIEKLTYPRFKGLITFGPLSDIEAIELLDNTTDPLELAKALREAGEFLLNHKPNIN